MIRPFIAHITGNPQFPTVRMVNVRARPIAGSNAAVLFQALIGTRALPILDVQPDLTNAQSGGKLYFWFLVRFPSGVDGWVRDDLLTLEGDGRRFGYPDLSTPTYAFSLLRQLLPTTPSPAPVPPPPVPVPVVPVVPTPDPSPVPTPGADLTAIVISQSGLNLRATPITGTVVNRLPYRSSVVMREAVPQGGTSNYKWARVDTASGSGWVRTDNLSINGNGAHLTLSHGDEYPAPMTNYWWVRGFNVNQNPLPEVEHLGWDFGAAVGEAIRVGPAGGRVMRTFVCTKCTATQPSTFSQGIPLANSAVFLDPAWGFGYGNAIIVRYMNSQLPASTRDRLMQRGLGGAHVYAIYAHLSAINASVNQDLPPNAVLGACGNTGNSNGAHLHLEVRASLNPNENWSSMRANLMDPEVLFLR